MNYAEIQREHDMADVSLRLVFGDAYSMLSSGDMRNVRADYLCAFREDGCTVGTYRERIGGKENLQAYARNLRGWTVTELDAYLFAAPNEEGQ